MTQQSQTARPMAAVLVASHAIDDLYQGAVPALVPFLVAEQDYLPGHIGTASGVTLGLAVSIGGLAAPLIGALAQASSLQISLALMLITTALAWAVSRHLPEPRHTPTGAASPPGRPRPAPAATKMPTPRATR